MVKIVLLIVISIVSVILSAYLWVYTVRLVQKPEVKIIGCPEYEQVFRDLVREDYKRLQTR